MKKNNQSFESARKHVDKHAATILGRISDEKEVGGTKSTFQITGDGVTRASRSHSPPVDSRLILVITLLPCCAILAGG